MLKAWAKRVISLSMLQMFLKSPSFALRMQRAKALVGPVFV